MMAIPSTIAALVVTLTKGTLCCSLLPHFVSFLSGGIHWSKLADALPDVCFMLVKVQVMAIVSVSAPSLAGKMSTDFSIGCTWLDVWIALVSHVVPAWRMLVRDFFSFFECRKQLKYSSSGRWQW